MNSLLSRMNELFEHLKNGKPSFIFKNGKLVETRDSLLIEYKNMLLELEWIMDDQWEEEFCPICLGWKKNGHDEGCRLEKLLK